MTIENNFLGYEDPEKVAASIRVTPIGIREVIGALLQKFIREKDWGKADDRPITPKRFTHEREY